MGVTVRELLMGQQRKLLTMLEVDREVVEHPTDKGDATELNWAGVIDDFLADRYKVARAQVLDADGGISDVLDVVIFDRQYCPLWFRPGGSQYIPAESVYAVFEVKQGLDAAHMDYAGKKAASVRKLHRTNAAVIHAGGRVDTPKKPFGILAGVLTLESEWKPAFGDSFDKALRKATGDERIDMGCVLRHGAFDVMRDEHGETWVNRSEPEAALMFFLMRLFTRLQAMGTVPAIDLGRYARTLEADDV